MNQAANNLTRQWSYGDKLRVGDVFLHVDGTFKARVIGTQPYPIHARVLHERVAAEYPEGLSGRVVTTDPAHLSFIAFDEDCYEVYR